MKNSISNFIKKISCNPRPSQDLLLQLKSKIDFDIDVDFLEFIVNCDGAEGAVSPEEYIAFWNIEDIVALNPYYKDDKECEKIFFFASDGSNFGYGFDKNSKNIIGIDFLDISEVSPKTLASSFEEFVKYLDSK
ncbi:hypothetical protein Dip518_001577 [Parelusimicrobium proximum]|uniref:SMI1/KNR4 family protein n=1 Tax=Parelusimicrobium proximum TaxID=3228953 RepID=UPI003D17F24F